MKTFHLWDSIEKSIITFRGGELRDFNSKDEAEEARDYFFGCGNYLDHPITVVKIIEEDDNKVIAIHE